MSEASAAREEADKSVGSDQITQYKSELTLGATVAPAWGSTAAIGPYRLLQEVGQGGMGEVWLAEQEHPMRRRVALKLVKVGMNSREVVARFESERQALALMDHPGIAKVFDAGSTAEGRPYFVMEYVPGVSITEYCDKHKLTTRERLELFVDVCKAVQHAHQKAIIHRDLKPSNILVTEVDNKPVPKIIDFGVAKAISQPLTAETMFTHVGALIGTPDYMSPEQANSAGTDVDTRTDVYSLGVILYELLVGALPLDFRKASELSFHELLHKLREEDAVRPSAKLRTVGDSNEVAAKRGAADPVTLARQLSGDLDCITLKALEKDRAARYSSPSDLATDIERYLSDQPVLAADRSTVYWIRKFVRRHRTGVTAGISLLTVLVILAITMTIQTVRVARERDRANREAESARRVADFLEGLFKQADPYQRRGRQVTAQELLDIGAKQVETQLGREPEIQARLMQVMGQSYIALGLKSQARPLVEQSWEIRKKLLGPDDPQTLSSMWDVFTTRFRRIPPQEAEKLARELLERARRTFGPDSLQSAHYTVPMIWALDVEERFAEEAKLARATLAIYDRHGERDTRNRANLEVLLGRALHEDGKNSEAVPFLREALPILRNTTGADSRDSIGAAGTLANALTRLREPEGINLYRDTLARLIRIAGPVHYDTLNFEFDMASALESIQKFADAESVLTSALQKVKEGRSKAIVLANLAHLNTVWGRRDVALRQLKEAVDWGYESETELVADRDWAPLRNDPRFAAIISAARRNERSK